MYKNNFVVAIKSQGKILRDNKGQVFLPFGEEYSILLKNLENRKAKIDISIDGKDVLNGKSLIIESNSKIELERFVNDLQTGNKFKFIEMTDKIEKYRGNYIEDGLIKVTITYEKENKWINVPYIYNPPILHDPPKVTFPTCDINWKFTDTVCYNNINEKGITTLGSISEQKFEKGYISNLEDNSIIITLELKGITKDNNKITKSITTKTPKICNVCGTKNKYINKFCRECGTFLKSLT